MFTWFPDVSWRQRVCLCWFDWLMFKRCFWTWRRRRRRDDSTSLESRVTTFLSSVLVCWSVTNINSIHKHLTSLWSARENKEDTASVSVRLYCPRGPTPKTPTGRLSQRQYGGLWLVRFFWSICPLVHPSIHQSFNTFIHPSVHPSFSPSICPSVNIYQQNTKT